MSVPEERSQIIVEDDALRGGFTQIPNAILRDPDITLGGKLAYATLLSYAWQTDSCFPGQETMARDMGVSKRSTIIFLQHLVTRGLISINRRGLGRTNVYTIHRLANAESAHQTADNRRSADSASQEVQKTMPTKVQNLHPKNTQSEEDEIKKMKKETAASGGAPSARFSPLPPTIISETPAQIQARADRASQNRQRRGFG